MNGYICFYKGVRKEIYAESAYDAQNKACEEYKIPSSKGWKISVTLAEKDGVQVVHSTGSI